MYSYLRLNRGYYPAFTAPVFTELDAEMLVNFACLQNYLYFYLFVVPSISLT